MANRKPETTCPAAKFQQMISGKYKLRILWSLKDGPLRYGEIKNGLLVGSEGTAEIAPQGSQPRIKDAGAKQA